MMVDPEKVENLSDRMVDQIVGRLWMEVEGWDWREKSCTHIRHP